MAKLDSVFNRTITKETALKQFSLPANYRYILFAPTFNDELSAIPFVMDKINEVIPDNNTIMIIKLHGSAKHEYKTMYKNLVQKDQRVIFADEHDITPFLALCDIMISDVSSAMMEFAALDKPLILFNNPNWKSYQNYNPNDIEFEWRDIGLQVTSLEEMKNAVIRSLENPKEFSDKRKLYTDQLFANKYGDEAAERIIEAAMALLSDTVKIKGAA
jgi:CDP-glycerol glycerophosphotransferase (TagB/SpsB family)